MKLKWKKYSSLTGNNEFDFLRHGGSEPVGGVAAVAALEFRDVAVVRNHKRPRIIFG